MKFELIRSFLQVCAKRGIPDPYILRHPPISLFGTQFDSGEIIIVWHSTESVKMVRRFEEALAEELPWVWLSSSLETNGSVVSNFKLVSK